jgi:hypothetical protein
LVRGLAGDPQHGDGRGCRAGDVGDVAFEQEGLVDVREGQVIGRGQDLHGACGDPPVTTVGLGVADRDIVPGQGIQRGEEFRLVFLDTEHELGATVVQVACGGALGVQRVGGDDHLGEVVDLVEQCGQHGDLIRFPVDLGLGDDQSLVVSHRGEQMSLVALGVDGAAHRFAVHREQHRPD